MAEGDWDAGDLQAEVRIIKTPTFGLIEGILWAALVISGAILIFRGLK